MNKNTNSTRYYSDAHELSICKALDGRRQPNSGGGKFKKGDIDVPSCNMLIEAKTTMTAKDSVSIKKEWIEKNRQEAFSTRHSSSAICFNFGPDSDNYYVIDEKLMKYLCSKLSEEI